MTYLILLASSIIFVELFIAFKILKDAQSVLALSSKSIGTLKSTTMTDREKEEFMRKNSLVMLITTFKFIIKFFVVFAVIYAFIMAVISFYPDLSESVMAGFTSIIPMVVLTVVTMIYVWGRNVISSKL